VLPGQPAELAGLHEVFTNRLFLDISAIRYGYWEMTLISLMTLMTLIALIILINLMTLIPLIILITLITNIPNFDCLQADTVVSVNEKRLVLMDQFFNLWSTVATTDVLVRACACLCVLVRACACLCVCCCARFRVIMLICAACSFK
jgi:hypothetical protein